MRIKTHKFVVLMAIVPPHKKSPLAWGQRASFVSRKTFDRNSQVRFHKCMVQTGLQKSLVQKILLLALLGGVCAVSGCAAVGSRIVNWGYFQGVRCDYDEMFRRDTIDPKCRIHPALAAIDMPFSFVGDIVFVPVDLYNSCERAANANALPSRVMISPNPYSREPSAVDATNSAARSTSQVGGGSVH
jgi:uncharacterized protein YceK